MTIRDEQPCDFLPASAGQRLVATGYLSHEVPFSTGSVSARFFETLCDHLATRWEPPFAVAGFHECDLCQFGSSEGRFQGRTYSSRSSAELFVPAGDCIFVAPVSIAHYIATHRYLPPQRFIDAVLACPAQRSTAYMQVFLDSGGRSWFAAYEALEPIS